MKILITLSTMFLLSFISCKKSKTGSNIENKVLNNGNTAFIPNRIDKINPYSVTNIQQALLDLNRNDQLDADRIYYYYKFNPSLVTGEILSQLESDEESKILDFPFADGSAYHEGNAEANEDEIETWKDGNLYIVLKANSAIANLFDSGSQIDAEKLNELYLPNKDDEDLQIQALITSGYSNELDVPAFKLHAPCLFKRPHGQVTYLDQETGNIRPVPRIKVWALVAGIPVSTHTDDNGNYQTPWLFSAGTYIGTDAENSRVNIKPLNTTGTWVGSALSLITNFIKGSAHTEGWFNACRMKDPINIHFGEHKQNRYWAQLLDAVHHHYIYTAQDNIHHAPTVLTLYAQWDNIRGGGSAPMLGHMPTNQMSSFANWASLAFNTNLSVTVPSLFQLMTGLMPDVTMKESEDINDYVDVNNTSVNHYSEHLMNYAFHELGHASLFQQVGQVFWQGLITNAIANAANQGVQNLPFLQQGVGMPIGNCAMYGCGNEVFAGLTQVNEAWAEFIGKEHHRRFHPAGQGLVRLATGGQASYQNYPLAQENVPWFDNNWINTGIFYDVMDPLNELPNDVLQGFTIQNMYNCFGPNTNGFCDWRTTFLQNNPNVTLNQMNAVMINQNLWDGNCYGGWPNPLNN